MPGRLHLASSRFSRDAPALSRIRIVLAGEHPSVRRNLRRLLDTEDDLEVVAEATDVGTIGEHLRDHDPHVLALGSRPTTGSITTLIRDLRACWPGTEIVIITMQQNRLVADRLRAAGALGYVLTDWADAELSQAIRRAAQGQPFVSSHVV